MHPNIDRMVGAQNLAPHISGRSRFRQRPLQNLRAQHKLASNINVGRLGTDCITGDQHPFDHLMWVSLDELPIFKGAGLAFICIAAEILRSGMILGNEAPLDPRRKSSSPSPSQA